MKDLSISKELGNRAQEGLTYGNLGIAYHHQGDFKEAMDYHKKYLSIAKEMEDKAEESSAYGNLGIAYHCLGEFKQAIEYHKKHLSISKDLGDRAGEASAYCNLGIAYYSLGDFKQAIEYHNKHLSISKELVDRAGEGRAYCNLGNAYHDQGDFKQAIAYHKKDLGILKELGDRAGEGRVYCNLGNAYRNLGDFKQAIEHHKKDLDISKELGDKAGEGIAYGNLGIAYRSLGDFQQAIDYHNKRLSISKELGDRAGEGRAYGNLGNTYYSLGYFKQAIDYHKKHLNISKELAQRAGEGSAYCNLGIAYYSLGDFKQAIEYHKKHLSISKELGKRAGEGIAYCNLGNAYHSLGDFKQAMDYHEEHLSISKELGQRAGEGSAYGNLGNAYHDLGDFEQAVYYHKKRLNLAKELGQKEGEGAAYCNLGNAYHDLGDFAQALDYHKKHLNITKELGDRAGEGRAYCNLGNGFACLGDFKQAMDYHNNDLVIAKELGERDEEARACYHLGCDLELLGGMDEALDYYRTSVKLYNEVRSFLQSEDTLKISFRNACRDTYTALWRTLVRLRKDEEALCVAEQGRAQALVDLMELQYGAESLNFASLEPNARLSDVLGVNSKQTVFTALEGTIINLWVLGKGGSVQFRQKNVESKEGEKSVEFLERIRKDAFKENKIGVRVTCENRSLDQLGNELSPSKDTVQETGETLDYKSDSLRLFHDCIIGPIADVLEGDELIIVPDGPLCLVPFAAFLDDKSRYLTESFKIRILPSLTSLKIIADCAQDYHMTSGALLVGDPCLEGVKGKHRKLEPLPGALKEVQMIGEILNTTPLTGRDATKDEVLKRLGSVALVHIAAHGDMKAGEILLAPNLARTLTTAKEKDYMLTMSDVQAVQLRARLVVLSCCHSAQGKVTPEGVVGIGRAFLGAGARSVLVSLWAIDDEATMEFMKSFYQHLTRGCRTSVALNQAMMCLRESQKFGAVKYWAPFVLIGDDVTIEFRGNQ